MRRFVHIAINSTTAYILATKMTSNPALAFTAAVAATIGSWLPDLDLRYKHRMFLHNVFAATILTIAVTTLYVLSPAALPAARPFFATDPAFFAAFHLLGYLLHIVEDITRAGVAPLYPLSDKRLRSRLTNDHADALGLTLLAVAIYAIFYR